MEWILSKKGAGVLEVEREAVAELMPPIHGYHFLQLSALDVQFFESTQLQHNFFCAQHASIIQTAPEDQQPQAVVDYRHLPFRDNTIDSILLHHVLDFTDNPHQCLREAARVLVPNGYLILVGFNPWSLMGGWRRVRRSKQPPWGGNHISPGRLHDWLALLGFRSEREWHGLFTQPLLPPDYHGLVGGFDRLLRWTGLPFGGVYIMVARKLVAGMTPIRPKWRPFPVGGIPVVSPTTRGMRVTNR